MNNQRFRKWADRAAMAALVALLVVGMAYSLPADLALLAAIDMATYVDALIGVYVVARIGKIRPMLFVLRASATGAAQRARARGRRLVRKSVRKTADDKDRPAMAVFA